MVVVLACHHDVGCPRRRGLSGFVRQREVISAEHSIRIYPTFNGVQPRCPPLTMTMNIYFQFCRIHKRERNKLLVIDIYVLLQVPFLLWMALSQRMSPPCDIFSRKSWCSFSVSSKVRVKGTEIFLDQPITCMGQLILVCLHHTAIPPIFPPIFDLYGLDCILGTTATSQI